MKYLVDTSVWLELLLEPEHAEEVRTFFNTVAPLDLACTEFALNSLGIILSRAGRIQVFRELVTDVFQNAGVRRIVLNAQELLALTDAMQELGLDFDDAYQYVAAQRYQLTLVSLDAHFDRTPLGRKTPHEVLTSLSC